MRTTADVVVLKNIYCVPVWRVPEGETSAAIAWFDLYNLKNGWYIGRKVTLEECEEVCLTLTN